MKQLKKEVIKETFLRMLEDRPLSQITVKDIVVESGVNRNTFYYHYSDLPSLIEDIVMDEAHKITSVAHSLDSLEECVALTISFTLEHKRAIIHLYNSSNRDIFIQYFMQIADHVLREFFDKMSASIDINASDKELLIHYHKCLLFGITVDWIRNGMTTDILGQSRRLFELYNDTLEDVLKKCALN